MKFHATVTLKSEIALPIGVKYAYSKQGWGIGLQVLFLLFLVVVEPKAAPAAIEYQDEGNVPAGIRAGKAYADERQKAKRNRRRKPKKAMANLYQLP